MAAVRTVIAVRTTARRKKSCRIDTLLIFTITRPNPFPLDEENEANSHNKEADMPQVSLFATLLATVLSFVLGGLWYGPLFAKTWMRLIGVSEATLREGFNPAKTYGVTFVLAFLMSYVFGMFLGPNPSMALGVGAGAAVGLFWVAGSLWTNDLFERRPIALTMINGGYHTVNFILIGLSFALLG
jgi:hypothetical protein